MRETRFAVIGGESRVRGYELAGAVVLVADDPEEIRTAWHDLPEDVGVVILTAEAAEAIGDTAKRLVAVLP